MSKPQIAFLGLGIMGSGMARRILAEGYPLTVFNRSRDKAAPFRVAGAKIAASPRGAAANADVILSMVSDDAASRALWLGNDGAIAGARAGTVLIECSTLTVGCVRELEAAAKERGCELLDAPVTGSRVHAASGELNFLVGGAAATRAKAQPILSTMSRSINHVGPTGSGALLKLINNFLCGVQAVSLAEAIALVERSGLDSVKAMAVLVNGTPGSPLMKNIAPRMANRDYEPNFLLSLMAKDLSYALDEGKQHGLNFTTVIAALEQFKHAIDAGRGDKDFSSVVEQFRSARPSPAP